MAKFYRRLNLIFFFFIVEKFCCGMTEGITYDMCSNTSVNPKLRSTGYIRFDKNPHLPWVQCRMVFHLCSECQLWLKFKSSNILNNRRCYPNLSSPCFHYCHYLRVVDEVYNRSFSFLFKPEEEYTSVSNQVSVTLCNHLQKDLKFEVTFRVQSKIQRLQPNPSAIIKSPDFPSGYVIDGEIFTYHIEKPLHYQDLLFTFTDWMIGPLGNLTVSNSTQKTVYFGNSSRPIFASRESIRIVFWTGYQTKYFRLDKDRGFKATIQSRSFFSTPHPPSADCGPDMILKGYGGTLRFNPRRSNIYDCVWVVINEPPFKHVTLRLESFQSISSTTLKFYEGSTSEGRYVETVRSGQIFRYQSPNGFYIRLQGRMKYGDILVLTYSSSTSRAESCPNAFRCKNGICIDTSLKCDGINHCLDKSDESECFNEREPPYQPLTSNWSVSIIIPIVITIFIFIILCLFFIFVRRFRKISRIQVPRRQSRLASVSRNISQQYLQNHFDRNSSLEEDLYSPPSYEEVMNSQPTRGNWNLAFNWSQQDLRDTPVPPPPPYSEYVAENEVNVYSSIADNDTSDLSTVPTDSSSSNIYTDPTSGEQNSSSESATDTLYLENIYATICETPANGLDQWMVDRSTSTSEQEMDADNNNKISVDEPLVRTQALHDLNTEMPSLRKNGNEDLYQSNLNYSNFPPLGADSTKSNLVLEKEDATKYQTRSANGQFLRSSCSRSMDMIPGSDSSEDNQHCGQNAGQNTGSKEGSLTRRNSYPSLIFLTDRQLNSEVFV